MKKKGKRYIFVDDFDLNNLVEGKLRQLNSFFLVDYNSTGTGTCFYTFLLELVTKPEAESVKKGPAPQHCSLMINISVAEPPLFWAAPEVPRSRSRLWLRLRPNWVGSGSRQKRRFQTAPAP